MIKVKEVQGHKEFEEIAEDHFYNYRKMHVCIRSIRPHRVDVVVRNPETGLYEAISCSIDNVGILVEGDFPSIYFCNVEDLNKFIDRVVQKYLES